MWKGLAELCKVQCSRVAQWGHLSYIGDSIKHCGWCKKSHISVRRPDLYLLLFNLLIRQLCHYFTIPGVKFIWFLWSVVDGCIMKHKPCFWRTRCNQGKTPKSLPALHHTQSLVASPASFPAGIRSGADEVMSFLLLARNCGEGRYFPNDFIAMQISLL